MVARLAISTTGRNGQYVGTTKVAPPTAEPGSLTCRYFNGTSDRLIGGRSNDLGSTFLLLMTFWRGEVTIAPNDNVGVRLFSQYCIGGTRIAVGFNRTFLAVNYTDASGANYTIESRVQVMDNQRHILALLVLETEFVVYMDGYEAMRQAATLKAPDTALTCVAADSSKRYFKGYIDDLATYKTLPRYTQDWLRYYQALTLNGAPRDQTASPFAEGYGSITLTNAGFTATGSVNTPLPSRVPLASPFRVEPELPQQNLEFRFLPISNPTAITIGLFNENFDLSAADLGSTSDSYAYTQDGRLVNNGVAAVTGITPWGTGDIMGLRWVAATRTVSLWKNGVKIDERVMPVGTWTAAISLGSNSVQLNAGQAYPLAWPLNTPGLPILAHSRLNTEFREMRLAEVCAPLNDAGTQLVDAYSGQVVGGYFGTPALVSGFTEDSLDVARLVGGGIKVNFGPYTAADDSFFFAIAYQPTADDLTGEKVILESPGSWGMKLIDGRLNAWVGSVQVGSTDVIFDAGSRYLIGMARSAAGKLLVWCHIGYILQSGDVTTNQTQTDVWVGSAASAANAVTGKLSHLVLASALPASWKLDRLRHTYDWDVPNVEGAIPNPATIRKVFEPSWRDVIKAGIAATPTALNCYAAAIAVAPDAMAIQFREISRKGTDAFAGDVVKPWTTNGLLAAGIGKENPAVIQLSEFTDLTDVAVGSVALIDDEIVRIDVINRTTGQVTVARGCIDTIPAQHGVGARMWFYEGDMAYTAQAYVLNDIVEVKLLSQNALTELEPEMAPSDTYVMQGRLNRPYPPAAVTINDQAEPTSLQGTVQVKWKHRNKSTQGQTVLDWDAASVTAPAAMTYKVRAYNPADGSILHESSDLASTVADYNLLVDFTGEISVVVTSYQNGLPCWQVPELRFQYTDEVVALMTTEDGEYIQTEDLENVVGLESLSALEAGSYSGELPDDYDWPEEEEEEEEGGGLGAGDDIVGIPISEFGQYVPALAGPELLPMVTNDTNYTITLAQVLAYVLNNIPPAVDGKSAYQIWLDNGHTGSEEEFLNWLKGPIGPSSNQSRRILTISNASGAIVCNWANYDEIRMRLTGNVVLTFQGAVNGQGCILKLAQDAVGGRTVTLPNTVRYNAYTAQGYTVTPGANLVDRIAFIYDSGDSVYDFNALAPGYFSGP